jgi:choline dehydrogenase-like flavoprotein
LTEIAPYYQRAQPFLGLHTDIFSAAQWSRRDQYHPFRLGSQPQLVTRVAQLVTDGPLSLAPRYRAVLGAADNVTVYLHANVTSIEVDAPGRTATEVRVAVLSGPRFTVRARRFVLATGGIENPRVLLASNARFPTGLGNRHDAVGRYFLEHPRFVSGTLLPTADRASVGFYTAHNVGSSRIEAYLAPVDEVQRREQLVDVQVRLDPVYGSGFAKAIASDDAEQLRGAVASARAGDLAGLERHVGSLASDLLTAPGYLLPGAPVPVPHPDVLARLATSTAVEREALLPALLGDTAAVGFLEATGRGPLRHLDVVTRIDPVPNRDSRVTLTGDRDALGMPRVDLDWRLSPLDRESVHRTMQLLVEQFGAHGLGRVRLTFDERSSGWPEDLVGGWHHMGTTRMSRDPRVGVVDPDCRVHGMSNLYVAGSSVFPTSGSGTPTMMIVALAIRLSEHLRRGL